MFAGVAVRQGTENAASGSGSSMSSLDRTLNKACRHWMRMFRAPLAHVGLVDADLMKYCNEVAARRSALPKRASRRMPAAAELFAAEDDEDKLIQRKEESNSATDDEACTRPVAPEPLPPPGDVWSDDEGMIAHDDDHDRTPPEEEEPLWVPVPVKAAAMGAVRKRNVAKARLFQDFRPHTVFAYPTPHPPETVIPDESSDASKGPVSFLDSAVPENSNDAESFLLSAALERSNQLDAVVAANRITNFPIPGRESESGMFKVKGDNSLKDQLREQRRKERLDFYIGRGTRQSAAM
jgi:hypothetical protein